MFKKLMLSAIVGIGAITAAEAADMSVPLKAPPPMPAPAFSWTGFYIGGYVGYDWTQVDRFIGVFGVAADAISLHPKGVFGGLQAGYNYQVSNNWVIGARVGVPFISSDINATIVDPIVASDSYSSKVSWAVAGVGTVGYAYDRWLPYVGAGVAVAGVKATINGPAFGGSTSITETMPGVVLEAGLQYALTDHWQLGVRYDYVNFASKNWLFITPAGGIFAPVAIGAETSAVAGYVNYKF